MIITKLPYVPNYRIINDVKTIHTVASISERGDAHGISFTKNKALGFKGAPMLNHYGATVLINRCNHRLRNKAKKINSNYAIVDVNYSISMTSSGSGIDGDALNYYDTMHACSMMATGEVVEIEKKH